MMGYWVISGVNECVFFRWYPVPDLNPVWDSLNFYNLLFLPQCVHVPWHLFAPVKLLLSACLLLTCLVACFFSYFRGSVSDILAEPRLRLRTGGSTLGGIVRVRAGTPLLFFITVSMV